MLVPCRVIVRTGAMRSSTVIVKVQALVLPLASVARQVTEFVPSWKTEPEGGEQLTDTFVSQASVAVAVKRACAPFVPVHSSVRLVGQVIVGGVVSTTVTTKLQPLLLPVASTAEQTTGVLPKAKTEPDGGAQVAETFVSQASVAVAGKRTCAPLAPVHSSVRLVGQVIVGGVVSTTVTTKLQPLLLPVASTAEQTTGVLPKAKTEPDGGAQLAETFVSQASVAVAVKRACAPLAPVHSSVRLVGQVIVGGVVSTTVTTKLQPLLLPAVSTAEQTTGVLPKAKTEPDGGAQVAETFVSQASLAVAVKRTCAPWAT